MQADLPVAGDGGGVEEFRLPRGRMRTLEKLPEPNATRRWNLELLTQGGVQWQIANRGFDPNRIDVAPRLGSTELWQWHNPSNRIHPMHLHGMLFRIVERSSGVIHPGERSWKDTVGVLPGETVTVKPWSPLTASVRMNSVPGTSLMIFSFSIL
jgi:FtsP/CotA-like multicopper oxidase with cupredoxin domain